jgi:uncharacterized protein YbaR (Trm112 family)
MKKFEITKEQILQLHQNTIHENEQLVIADLKNWFPEVFKKELEVGKWYKDKGSRYNGLICVKKYNGENNGITAYGFSWVNGSFDNHSRWCASKESKDDLIEATPQEVESALICEAKKRWYEIGVYVKCLYDESKLVLSGKKLQSHSESYYVDSFYQLWMNISLGRNVLIFSDGIWAQIIQPEKMTLEQIEKELGRKIELI